MDLLAKAMRRVYEEEVAPKQQAVKSPFAPKQQPPATEDEKPPQDKEPATA